MAEKSQASWKNRRRMSWLAFALIAIFVIGLTYRLMFSGDDPGTWIGLGTTVFGILGAIVLSYLGLATWDDIQARKNGT